MNQIFGLILVLLLCTASSATAQTQTYLEPKMSLSQLQIYQDETCVVIVTDHRDDLLCFFDEKGKQFNLSGYEPEKRQDGRYNHPFCEGFLYVPSTKTIFYGGNTLTHYAYRVRR